jgi:pentapeptide MXKDX repeat protein
MKKILTGIMTLWLLLGLAVGQFSCLSGAGNKAMMGDDMQSGATTMQNDAMKSNTMKSDTMKSGTMKSGTMKSGTMGDSMSGSTNTMKNDTMH